MIFDYRLMFSIAFSLFLLMDPIGNIPLYISVLKEIKPKRQRWIIFRELIIALVIIIIFDFLGNELLNFLHISRDAVQISGGIILFLIALKMIFPKAEGNNTEQKSKQEPFIVPLAVPLIAGPSVLAAVMLYTHQQTSDLIMIPAIIIAWLASLVILILSSYLHKLLGWRGITALERLMGLILIMIALQMFLDGIHSFISLQTY